MATERLFIAKDVIAAQAAREKQVAADHLYSKQLQREEKIQEDRREAARINKQREILDREIGEQNRRNENI